MRWLYKKLRKKHPIIVSSAAKELFFKKKEFDAKAKQITTVALGSSHGAQGFIAHSAYPYSFNLCSASQDLYYSRRLYDYSLKKNKNIKHILFFYSVFSQGFDLIRTNEAYRAAFFRTIYKFPYRGPSNAELKEHERSCRYYLRSKRIDIPINHWGYCPLEMNYMPVELAKRVHTHLRENRRENDIFDDFMFTLTDCLKRGIKLSVIIAPVQKGFHELLPSKKELFQRLYEVTKNTPVRVLEYFDSSLFLASDFSDSDHLNHQGATKLTNFIHHEVGFG